MSGLLTDSVFVCVSLLFRFLHPIVHGEYPESMQRIVADRLPKFTQKEISMVKGSVDFVGINQYTTYYAFDPKQPKPKITGYQMDWNVGFACKKDSYIRS